MMGIREMIRASPPLRRMIDGSLYELTVQQKKRCDELCRRECCNYYQGNCLLLEDRDVSNACAQMLSWHICCRWFQNSVLPLNWKLEGEIFCDDHMMTCRNCGCLFRTTATHVKYCPDCRTQIRKRKNREYKARSRQK